MKSKLIISICLAVTAAAIIFTLFTVIPFVSGKSSAEPASGTASAQTVNASENKSSETTQTPETAAAKSAANPSSAAKQTQPQSEANPQKLIKGFSVISQLPELPTGCEVTSLTMLLNYLGFDADKLDLADNYLTKGEYGVTDPRKAFVGDPRNEENSRGCYAPVLTEAANKYLADKGSGKTAQDISGRELESLFPYIDKGIPVIVWGIMDCLQSEVVSIGEADGQPINWVRPEHCMVLIGYDDNQIIEADPYHGTAITYNKEQFRTGYNDLFKQAVIIQ